MVGVVQIVKRTFGWRWGNVRSFWWLFEAPGVICGEFEGLFLERRLDFVYHVLVEFWLQVVGVEDGG